MSKRLLKSCVDDSEGRADRPDEALAAAEEAGRRSMQELRGTVAMLRGADESAVRLPLADLAQLGALVDSARRDGIVVEYRVTGDLQGGDLAIGLALDRIAQEALLNAVRPAPHASIVVAVTVTASLVVLEVDSLGTIAAQTNTSRPGYGLIGMRERAATVGGELQAGPTPEGWRVSCRVSVRSP